MADLADEIIEHGPYEPGDTDPLHGWPPHRADELNALREELIEGRQAIEDLREFLEREEPA